MTQDNGSDDPVKRARSKIRLVATKGERTKKEAPPPKDAGKPASKSKTGGSDGPPKWDTTDAPTLPPDCPVVPLGRDARLYAFIDANKQFLEIDVQKLGSDGVADLFANKEAFAWLWEHFPRFNKEGRQTSFDKERVKLALMIEGGEKGPFDFSTRVRGVGAWSDSEGRLHWHLGDQILVTGPDDRERLEAGPLVGAYVYPRGAKQPRPPEVRDAATTAAMADLYALLGKWNWARGETDARLLLGWIACAMLGGALRWRPHLWVRGATGSVKSTLQLLLQYLAGGEGSIVQASDASGAGIWTSLKNRSLPVALDEMEAKSGDNRHADNVINLARQAASGGRILRGGANHTSHEFTAHAAFLFSSINVPPLEPQDAVRIGQLRLLEAPAGASEILFGADEALAIGCQLRRILVDGWPLWARLFRTWRDAFIQLHGLSPRIGDTWGSLLAMADLCLNVEERLADGDGSVPKAELERWTGAVVPDLKRMLSESGTEWERLLRVLLQTKLDPYTRGQRWTIETLVAIAGGRKLPEELEKSLPDTMSANKANGGLIVEGLKVVTAEHPRTKVRAPTLAVQKRHAGLDQIFFHTKWKHGVYAQQFEAVPGAWSARQRFAAGKREPSIMIPLDQILGEATNPLDAAIADAAEDRAAAQREFEITDQPPPTPPAPPAADTDDDGMEPD